MTQPIALPTPCLLLDADLMQANIERMDRRLASFGVRTRPHVKTAKSLPVIERMVQREQAGRQTDVRLTVSTVREAAEVIGAGYRDVLYAVGIVPQKLAELTSLAGADAGVRISVILDSVEMAQALLEFLAQGTAAGSSAVQLDAFIELDVDAHRAGVNPGAAELLAIGQLLNGASRLRGVMTHAGYAYECRSKIELLAMAERERSGAVLAAERLAAVGVNCPEVSIGSTPTVSVAESFAGITEVRTGVYVFNDLVIAGLGVCAESQIALSVLASVIGHQPGRNTLVIDAGWMALSNDRSTATHATDMGLGKIMGTDLCVRAANQEHGLVQTLDGTPLDFARFPIGSKVRVLPIHACATAAAFAGYQVFGGVPGSRSDAFDGRKKCNLLAKIFGLGGHPGW